MDSLKKRKKPSLEIKIVFNPLGGGGGRLMTLPQLNVIFFLRTMSLRTIAVPSPKIVITFPSYLVKKNHISSAVRERSYNTHRKTDTHPVIFYKDRLSFLRMSLPSPWTENGYLTQKVAPSSI